MVKKLLVLLILAMLVLAGCGQAKKETGIKVAMVTDVGGVNDQSFNQSAWEGLQRAEKELGVNLLNSRGNKKNTRSLGKDIISELKAQGKECQPGEVKA